jgi:hypothetical protein
MRTLIAFSLCLAGCAAMLAEAREPATMLPTAPDSACVNASAGDHVYVGATEYQCQQDPTSDPGGDVEYTGARRRRLHPVPTGAHRECLRVMEVHVGVSLVGAGGATYSAPSNVHWECRDDGGVWRPIDAGTP